MASKDQRRVTGPEKTTPYSVFQNAKAMEFLEKSGMRHDGRSPVDIQPIFMAVDIISQAKGSSFIEIGNTKVVCAVYGPKEVQRGIDFKLTGQVYCEVKFAPFSSQNRKSPQPDRKQKEISRQLKEALEAVIILEKYPKALIDVFITVVEDGGSILSTCLTAAGLALCHASIDVFDLVVGSSVIWNKGIAFVDTTRNEEDCLQHSQRLLGSEGNGSLTVGMMPKYANGQIALMVHEGEIPLELLSDGITLAIETSQRIYTLARETLLSHVEKVLQENS